jgi:histidinol dehydrogenase
LIEVVTDAKRLRERLDAIHARSVSADAELTAVVAQIVEDVRRRGDAALIEYAARFDGVRLRPSELRVEEAALRESAARCDGRVLEAVRASIRNVRAFHERELIESWEFETTRGVRLGQRVTPVEAAGLYVPGA